MEIHTHHKVGTTEYFAYVDGIAPNQETKRLERSNYMLVNRCDLPEETKTD